MSRDTTVVDIVMPYYGDVALMRIAVNSVLAQDNKSWRLTVVDDGTEPGVPQWFEKLGDDRVRYERNERNLGVTANFNKCVGLIEHDLAVIMGCDDVMLPNYVDTILAVHADHPDAGIIQPGVQVIDAAGAPARTLVDEVKRRVYAPRFRRRLVMAGEDLAVSLLRADWLYFPSLCWRSAALKQVAFSEEYAVIQDLALLLELIRRGENMVVDDTLCFQYRRHSHSKSSETAVNGSRFTEAGRFFAAVASTMAGHGWRRAARVARLHLSSRVFALTYLPAALKHRSGVRELARHAFEWPKA
ncbi:MAG TPA: glycosyltransferase family A protein [Actinokineospora sp.]|jgi:GT2 family glycosyltransferase|nr:glycosyltransferase family A protein [Actinokineospora sp.]